MKPAFRHPLTAYALSIATVSLAGTLQEKLEAAANIGFDGVEIFENDLLTFDGTPEDVRRMCADLGLAIDIFQPFRDFEAMPEPQRARNMDRAERKFDVMQALGTDLVLVCSAVHPACIDDPARAAADLHEMAERAAKRGLRVGFEALAWGRHTSRWRQAWDIVAKGDHPNLGLIVDSFHTLCLNDDPSGIADVPAEKLFFVQLADAPKLSMDVLSWSRHFRNFPGQGQLDITSFMRAVQASGYTGPLSLEIFNDDFRSTPSRLTARDGLRSLIFAQDAIGALSLPKAPVFDGVEFLEFAVDDAAHDALAAFITTLGFRRAGTHRSKNVSLYRQGRINLVLNAEQDSAASEHFLLHGPSVCAVALRVDDPARAIARARALLSPDWHERVGEGERRIPAVRAPDGTLIYLVESSAALSSSGGRSIFENDFILADPGGVELLTGTDHIAQALPTGRMDSYVLFYRAIFGFEAQATFELPDPYGLIRSRAMVSADGSVRMPLNISESRETATGRFVSAFAGAGVHHMAFATTDIFSAVAEMRRHGARFLPIPPNYYDDLMARHGLDEGFLARLQALDLLYDRDEHGEFIHAFSETFDDRFFFEVVQRDGYDGFGAVNAAVRMAVQAQRRDAVKLGARLAL
jgi:4-hydroxyphenylpyruvate dioxygenase